MAAEIPKFISQETFKPAPVVSAGKQFEGLAKLFDNMGDVVHTEITKNQHEKALEQGEAAGLNQEFNPIPNINDNARLFNKAGEEAHKQFLSTELDSHYNKLQLDVSQIPDAKKRLEVFTQLSDTYNENLLKNVTLKNKPFINNKLQSNKNLVGLRINKDIIKQVSRKNSVELSNSLATSKNRIIDYIRNGAHGAAKREMEEVANKTQLSVLGGQMSIKQREGLLRDYHKLSRNEIAEQTYQKLPLKDREQYRKNVLKSKIPGFSTDDKLGLIDKLKKIDKDFAAKVSVNSSIANSQYKDMLKDIEHFGILNDQRIIHNQKLLKPGQEQIIDDQINSSRFVHDQFSSIIKSPLRQQIDELETLRPKTTDKNFVTKRESFNRISALVNNSRKELLDDGYKAVQTNDAFRDIAQNTLSAAQEGMVHVPFRDSGMNPVELAHLQIKANVAAQRHAGLNEQQVKVAQNARISSDLNEMSALQPAQLVQFFGEQRAKYGEFYNKYIQQLVKDNSQKGAIDSSLFFLSSIGPKNPSTRVVTTALSTPIKELEGAVNSQELRMLTAKLNPSDVRDNFQNTVTDDNYENFIASYAHVTAANKAEFLNSYKQYVKRVSMQFMLEGSSVDDAFTKAANTVMSNKQFIEISDGVVAIPQRVNGKALDSTSVYAKAKFLEIEKLKDFNFTLSRSTTGKKRSKKATREIQFATLVKPGHWVQNGTGDGLIWVNARNVPIMDENNNRFGFKFNDLEIGFRARGSESPVAAALTLALGIKLSGQ